jgi:hypothetical protein
MTDLSLGHELQNPLREGVVRVRACDEERRIAKEHGQLRPVPSYATPYSVTINTQKPAEYVLSFGGSPNTTIEVYQSLAAALIRAEDLRRGIASASWIVASRVTPTVQTVTDSR